MSRNINLLKYLPHHCYLITNLLTNKVYVGITYKKLNQRLSEHFKVSKYKNENKKQYLHKSINKYGEENFKIELIESFDNAKMAYEAEKYYINKYNSDNDMYGYNLTNGGDCGPLMIKYTREQIINILNDYCAGLSIKDISKKYNMHYNSIFDLTRFRFSSIHNIPKLLINKVKSIKSKSNKRIKVNKKMLINIFKDFVTKEFSLTKLALKYNLSVSNMYTIIHRESFKNIKIDQHLIDSVNDILLNNKRFWKK